MRINSLEVVNFRALRNSSVDFSPATALIGENNCGKSAFLRALDLFFSGSPRVKSKDFSDDEVQSPIDITIHFSDLTPHERIEFGSNLLDGDLIVTRRILPNGTPESGQYFISARVNPDFSACRNEDKKTEKRNLYKELQEKYDLPNISNADQIDGHLEAWEAENEGALKIERVAGFKGWKNVAVGKLKQKTEFIFIRAMEDAEQIDGDKNSPVRTLVNTIARQTIENTDKYKQFLLAANATIAEITDPANVPLLAEISTALTGILSRYYKDSGIATTWEPITQIQPSFPTATIEVTDNDFKSGVDGVGHGLQRAIVLTVLQFLAERRASSGGGEEAFAEAQSDIIIAIEEPESFQHPTKQRLFANILRNLAQGFNAATGIRIQTIIVTHSPLMVSLSECASIRMIRHVSKEGRRNVLSSDINLGDCAKRSAEVSGRAPEEAWTASQYAAKLHTFGAEIAEGFFSKCVVLVEGVGDKAILSAAYRLRGRDPYAEGVVISDVTGKNNLDKPIIIFDELNIPCYWVFDNDRSDGPGKAGSLKANRILQRLSGIANADCVEWPEGVFDRFAVWDFNLEDYVRERAGPEKFYVVRAQIADVFHIDPDICLKFPASAAEMLKQLVDLDVEFPELDEIIKKVDQLIAA